MSLLFENSLYTSRNCQYILCGNNGNDKQVIDIITKRLKELESEIKKLEKKLPKKVEKEEVQKVEQVKEETKKTFGEKVKELCEELGEPVLPSQTQ